MSSRHRAGGATSRIRSASCWKSRQRRDLTGVAVRTPASEPKPPAERAGVAGQRPNGSSSDVIVRCARRCAVCEPQSGGLVAARCRSLSDGLRRDSRNGSPESAEYLFFPFRETHDREPLESLRAPLRLPQPIALASVDHDQSGICLFSHSARQKRLTTSFIREVVDSSTPLIRYRVLRFARRPPSNQTSDPTCLCPDYANVMHTIARGTTGSRDRAQREHGSAARCRCRTSRS